MNENDVTPTAEVMNQNPEAVSIESTENGREPTSRGGSLLRSCYGGHDGGQAACSTEEGEEATASESQISANRRNALKSTGPRTAKGKKVSRMNAMKHGILSTALVVRGLRIREHEDEFKTLREQCWECLAPVGRMEEMLVDKIVTAQWRMRRALMAETGEIVKSVDGGQQHRANREPLSQWIFMDPTRDASVVMTKSSAGLEFLKYILETVRENLRRDGELTEKTLEWVQRRFMNQANQMTRELERLRATYVANPAAFAKASASAKASAVAQSAMADKSADTSAVAQNASSSAAASAVAQSAMADKPADEMADKEDLKLRHQTAVERYVEATLGWQAKLNAEHHDREDKAETAWQAADVLPSSEVLEKIIRYEGSLDRQLYRAMNQLERLQRRREGEDVKPPLMMDVMR